MSCCTLTRSKSNHFPILLSLARGAKDFASSFKFLRTWASHPDCKRLVPDTSQVPMVGCPMEVLSQKLKLLKSKLKEWNKSVFGDVHNMVNSAKDDLDHIQHLISTFGGTDALYQQKRDTRFSLQQALVYRSNFGRRSPE